MARTENFFDLIDLDHVSLAHAIVAGVVGLGYFFLVFGGAATLAGLIGAAYTYLQSRENPRWRTPGFRRTFVIGTSALVLLAVGSAAWASSDVSYEDKLAAEPGGPSDSAGQKEDHTDCDEHPTSQQQEAADNLAADTKAGVAKYEDPSVAEAEGYRPSSPDWRPIPHYLNPAYQRDEEILDPNRQEALVYANSSNGPVLLGAMYLMPEPGVSGPQIGGCLTQWHAHLLLGWETPEMMHVWTVDIPDGPFSELRPREFVSSLED
ncbi:MAG: hypothetical protein M3259_00385 [Actinomycetota bacterium]|nr:hypothetical protein [Actinomycetota bacterium]